MKPQRHERRGVIILIVLSMLVLFIMMGATLLVFATRTRAASRAFLAASDRSESASPILPRTILDEALLLLIRGSRDPGADAVIRESLLGDMYGPSGKNRVPFRAVNPEAASPHDEAYDAFDDRNPFLSQITSNGTVLRAAFQPAGGALPTLEVDNDYDGVPDGIWLSATSLFGNATSARGSPLSFRVSYLVLDLDGRINVNAHGGSGTPTLGPASIDLSASGLATIMGNSTLANIQNGATPSGGFPARNLAVIPDNLRQSPVLSGSRTVPGRGGEPYTLRLDSKSTAQGDLTASGPFSLGELERVLRPFDSDWSTLPPRLASMVNDLDGAARRSFTTESWDVPFMTGLATPPAGAPIRPKFDMSGRLWGKRAGGLDKANAADREAYANELYRCLREIFPGSSPPAETPQWCANVAEHWAYAAANPPPGNMTITWAGGNATVQGVAPTVVPGEAAKWDGIGIVSAADLLAVPKGSKSEIETWLDPMAPQPVVSLAAESGNRIILDAVVMPSPFELTTQNENTRHLLISDSTTGNVTVREPGRVNLNTCSDEIWDAVWGGTGPTRSPSMGSTWDVLAYTMPGDNDVRGVNRDKANHLAQCATVRSNVFAIWITLEVHENSVEAGPPTLHRLFAIVDRSIPVNYARGVNTVAGLSGSAQPGVAPATLDPMPVTTDVRDIIRLKRYLN